MTQKEMEGYNIVQNKLSYRLMLWTKKEAYLKYIGAGFTINPQKIELSSISVEFSTIWFGNYCLTNCGTSNFKFYKINYSDIMDYLSRKDVL